jgi:hypothetical protein
MVMISHVLNTEVPLTPVLRPQFEGDIKQFSFSYGESGVCILHFQAEDDTFSSVWF